VRGKCFFPYAFGQVFRRKARNPGNDHQLRKEKSDLTFYLTRKLCNYWSNIISLRNPKNTPQVAEDSGDIADFSFKLK